MRWLMAARHAQYVGLFPTARAIPEALQIGRTELISEIEAMVLNGTSVLLLEERRIGKSSVGSAVIERVRAGDEGALAISLDLRYVSRSSAALAREMLVQARSQGADRHVGLLLNRNRLTRAGREARAVIGNVGKVFGEEDEATMVSVLLGELTKTTQDSIGAALKAIDGYARLRQRRVIVFFDEIQELVKWTDSSDVQLAIASTETRSGSQITYIFAGSEKTAIRDLFVAEGELEFVGQRVELPVIPTEDWQRGLAPRFLEAGLVINPAQIAQIYVATDGHPLRTMSVCAQTVRIVPGDEVTEAVVRQAIRAAKDHPSWRER
jgi:hypothetical protein